MIEIMIGRTIFISNSVRSTVEIVTGSVSCMTLDIWYTYHVDCYLQNIHPGLRNCIDLIGVAVGQLKKTSSKINGRGIQDDSEDIASTQPS